MPRPAGWTPTTPIDEVNLNANTKDVIGDLDMLNKIYFPSPYNANLVSAINAVPSMMSKTFYVDAVNGDDLNDGSSTAPFKTIKKAVDSVPVGGYGTINLLSGITITTSFSFENKVIRLKTGTAITSNADFKWLISDGGSIVPAFNSMLITYQLNLKTISTPLFKISDVPSFSTLVVGGGYPNYGLNIVQLSTSLITVEHSFSIISCKFLDLSSATGTTVNLITKNYSGIILYKENNITNTDTLISRPTQGIVIL